MSRSDSTPKAAFVTEIGAALLSWQLVEMALCSLLTTVMRSPDPRLGPEIFYAVVNFRDKLSLVDAAVRFTFWNNKKLISEWNTLNERTKKRGKRRNAIVHNHIVDDVEAGDYKLGSIQTFSRYMKAQLAQNPDFIDIKQLREASKSFRLLAENIRAFDERVREYLTLRQ